MKKKTLVEFINKHTANIERCRWVSDAKEKTLKVNALADTKNLLCDITLNNWEGFGDAEVGISNLAKIKTELGGLCGDEITTVLNYNDDKSRIIGMDVMDGDDVFTITTSDLDMIPSSSKLKEAPPVSAEIIIDESFRESFLKGKNALPDVTGFTVMMNDKKKLMVVIGFSNINSSNKKISVKTSNGNDTVDGPLHFRADYFKDILAANSDSGDSVLKVSDQGICSIEFTSGDFVCKYYLTSTADQD